MSRSASRQAPDWWLFLSKFLRHGTAIASPAPSSVWLARALIAGLDLSRGVVVELGAGTGPITAELLRRAGPGCQALIVERDPDFCRRLRRRFPGADVVQADALDLEALLKERGIERVDHFLSGLPLPSFAARDRDRVLRVVGHYLAPAGTFRQLTDMPGVYYRLYRGWFAAVQFRLVVRNLPPGGVYVCRGWRERRPTVTHAGRA